ncbi:MAG: alpha/beta fold hydrolase [Anaerolineae bacterium]|jgi:carboxylesterase|nr:alpha/beta fold hydrolase [Anaerolineae bacterium]MBT7074590.1 alpha/beta fold hydrolase [Anaerolineae bacterium]MBT7781676.1 alpha/beta fold hydrolase [Anaerolineae bacterium]
MIIPSAEPFYFPGNKTGCLLVHGFTGAPKEMRWMGEYLAEEGFSVLGVRLAGHATKPEDMIRTRYIDWIHSVEDGYHLLKGTVDQVFLIGLSMGGALSLLMASKLDVAGVFSMSAPYELNDSRIKYTKILSKFISYVPKRKGEPGANWMDKEAWRTQISYPENPLRSVAELAKLLREMRSALPKIDMPVQLVHSRNDTYIVGENMEKIYADLTTADKNIMWVTESGHVIPREPAKAEVFSKAAEFIRRVVAEK